MNVAARIASVVWSGFSLVVLVVMLLHESDGGAVFGRYTPRYAVLLGLMLFFVVCSDIVLLLVHTNRLRRLAVGAAWRAQHIGGISAVLIVAVAAFWLLAPISDSEAGMLFRFYVAAGLLLLLLALLYEANAQHQIVAERWARWFFAGLLVAAVGAALIYVGQVPGSRYFDEAWLTAWGQGLASPHLPTDPMVPARDELRTAVTSSLTRYGLGHWINLLGVGFNQARLYSLFLAWLGLPFIYQVARQLYGRTAAWSAVVFGVLFALHHSYVYPSGWVATATAIGLYLYFSSRPNQPARGRALRHFLSGVVVASALEGHPYGIMSAFGLGAMYAVDFVAGLRRRQWDYALVWYVLGGLGYAVVWLAFRMIVSEGALTFSNITSALQQSYGQQVELGKETSRLQHNLALYAEYLTSFPLEFALLLVGTAFAVWRAIWHKSEADRRLLLIMGVSLLAFAALLAKYNVYYWIFYLPFVTLLAGALIRHISPPSLAVNRAQLTLVLALFVLVLAFTASIASNQNVDDMIDLGYAIDAVLPEDITHVNGWDIYYYGLHQRGFTTTQNFILQPETEHWGTPPPQAIIVTKGLDDRNPHLLAYIRAHDFQPALCFDLRSFGKRAVLFLPAAVEMDSTGQPCTEQDLVFEADA